MQLMVMAYNPPKINNGDPVFLRCLLPRSNEIVVGLVEHSTLSFRPF